jgi:hypothetical protein
LFAQPICERQPFPARTNFAIVNTIPATAISVPAFRFINSAFSSDRLLEDEKPGEGHRMYIQFTVALLIFFSATAGAGIISSGTHGSCSPKKLDDENFDDS